MKSNNFIAVATILLVLTYLLVMRMHPDEPSDMARCIPSTALVYFEQHNGVELFSHFFTSPLGKKIEALDFGAVAKEIGMAPETIAAINNFAMVGRLARTNPLTKELFSNGFALALLQPLNDPPPLADLGDFLLENLVLVGEPQHPAKVLEVVAATFHSLTDAAKWTTSAYGRHRILRIVGNGQSFSFVRIDGLFLIGQNETHLRRCIDTYDGELPSFANNTEFLALKNSLPAPDSILAVPSQNEGQSLASFLAGYDLPDLQFLAQIPPLLAGIKGFGYSAKRHTTHVTDKIIVHLTSPNVDDRLRDQPSTPPGRPSMVTPATANPLFYLWSNGFHLNRFLTLIGKKAKGDRRDKDGVVRTFTDGTLKNLALLGKEITVIAEPGIEGSSLPIPLVTVFVPVGDKDALKAGLSKMLDGYAIPMKTGEYGSAEYAYWSQAPQDGLFPLYGFWGELFFLGNSQTLLQQIIDTQGQKLSPGESDLAKIIDGGLADGNNTVMYSNNAQLINISKDILNIAATVIAIEDRDLALKARVVIERILGPLLDGAKMYATSITRSTWTPEMVEVNVSTNISKSPTQPEE